MPLRSIVPFLFLTCALAACAGAGSGPPGSHAGPAGAGRGGIRQTRGSNTNLFDGSYWAASSSNGVTDVVAWSLVSPEGNPLRGVVPSLAGLSNTAIANALSVAPDGTVYVLMQNQVSAYNSARWELQIFAPGATAASAPEQTISGTGWAADVVIVADGIDVLWGPVLPNDARPTGAMTVSTYKFAAGNNPQPIRTLNAGTGATDVASDGDDRLYVALGGNIEVYPAGARGTAKAIRTIRTPAASIQSIAVAGDGTVYALAPPATNQPSIYAYAPGDNGPAPSRTIGPFTETRIGAIAVDSKGDLYAAELDSLGRATTLVYGPSANGKAAPLSTLTASAGTTALAIGPAIAGATPSPTPAPTARPQELFAGVSVYPLDGTGPVSPTRSYPNAIPPSTPQEERVFVGDAAQPDGTLSMLVRWVSASGGNVSYSLYTLPPGAGAATKPFEIDGNGFAEGVGIDGSGNVDVAVSNSAGNELDVLTYRTNAAGAAAIRTLRVPSAGGGAFETDASGRMYVFSPPSPARGGGQTMFVAVYQKAASGLASPIRTFTIALPSFADDLVYAVAADGAVYAIYDSSYANTGVPSYKALEFAPTATGAATPSRTLGVASGAVRLGVLATTAGDDLIVGYTSSNGSTPTDTIETFAATGVAASPLRTMQIAPPEGGLAVGG